MVKSWLPEPPQGADDDSFHLDGGPPTLVESDDNDDQGFDHMGYVLLPPDMTQGLSFESENSAVNDSDNDSDVQETDSEEIHPTGDAESLQVSSEASGSSRTDISVDCDQVRAAMSNITLPPSAIPSWAAEIPESHWKAFLMARINNLQTGSEMK